MANLERHPNRRNEWVGYSDGVWRVTAQRDKRGVAYRWDAVKQNGEGLLSAPTLKQMSAKLAAASSASKTPPKAFEITLAGFSITLEKRPHACKIPEHCNMSEYVVTYGEQVQRCATYSAACSELGAAIMHALTLEGKLD